MKIVYKTALSIFLAILFLSFLFLFREGIYEKESARSIYDTGQNGYSEVYNLLREKGHSIKIEANNSNNIAYLGPGALWVIFPQEVKYSKEEIEKIKNFVSRGGMLFIADRFGNAGDVAKEFGISVFNHTIVEYDSYEKRQDLPILPAAIPGNDKIYSLAFKFPTAIDSFPIDAEIVSKSSRISFIDSDDNGKITTKDQAGPFPVAVKIKYKEGLVAYFSDSSAFTNDLIARKDNAEFFQDMIRSLNPDIIVFDESHNENKTLTKNFNFFIFILDLLKNGKTYMALFVLIAAFFLLRHVLLKTRKKDSNKDAEFILKPTEYSSVAKRIMSNCGNNIYTRKWVIFMGYNKIKENILSKARMPAKNISKEYLLENSGLEGEEKNNLALLIDLGMSLERGDRKDISYSFMRGKIREMERINNLLK